jgi:hypothetical protein
MEIRMLCEKIFAHNNEARALLPKRRQSLPIRIRNLQPGFKGPGSGPFLLIGTPTQNLEAPYMEREIPCR